MKIVRGGFLAKDGIHVTCKLCGCEWVVEGREDMRTIPIYRDFEWEPSCVEYFFPCPQCNWELRLGVNPKYAPKLLNKYKFIFNRDDWDKRYEINIEDLEGIEE